MRTAYRVTLLMSGGVSACAQARCGGPDHARRSSCPTACSPPATRAYHLPGRSARHLRVIREVIARSHPWNVIPVFATASEPSVR